MAPIVILRFFLPESPDMLIQSDFAVHIFMNRSIQKSKRITSTNTTKSTRITCLLEDGNG